MHPSDGAPAEDLGPVRRVTRRWRAIIASALLLLTGLVALVAMGPQFVVFVPIVLGAWLLARFGLVPRVVHHAGESVRIAGGPVAGQLAFAEITIRTEPARRGEALDLLADIVERIDRRAGPGAAPAACIAGRSETPERAPAALARDLPADGAEGLVLAWPGGLPPLDCTAEGPASWKQRWPALVREQSSHGARFALEATWHEDGGAAVSAALVGAQADLGPLLARLATELRARHDVEAWTSGWVREAERSAAVEEAARRRRSAGH